MRRREFLQTSLAASAGGLTAAPAPQSKTIRLRDTIPVAEFGKTGHQLPLLACGGCRSGPPMGFSSRHAKFLGHPEASLTWLEANPYNERVTKEAA
jgi:hypothetical protein